MRISLYLRQSLFSRKRATPWRWPPVRSFTFANILRLVLGVWILNAPLLSPELSAGEPGTQSQLIVGGCIAALAAMRIIFIHGAGIFRWAHLFLGSWTIASPWVFDYAADEAAFWNSAVCGALIAGLATWSLLR